LNFEQAVSNGTEVFLDIYANHFEPSYPLLLEHPEIETIPSLLYDYPGRLPAPASSR
jgi:hypothetical protein